MLVVKFHFLLQSLLHVNHVDLINNDNNNHNNNHNHLIIIICIRYLFRIKWILTYLTHQSL